MCLPLLSLALHQTHTSDVSAFTPFVAALERKKTSKLVSINQPSLISSHQLALTCPVSIWLRKKVAFTIHRAGFGSKDFQEITSQSSIPTE